MKSGCYVIHDASTLLDVASSTRCGNYPRAFCAKETKQLTPCGSVSTVCTASLRKSAEPASCHGGRPRSANRFAGRVKAVCRSAVASPKMCFAARRPAIHYKNHGEPPISHFCAGIRNWRFIGRGPSPVARGPRVTLRPSGVAARHSAAPCQPPPAWRPARCGAWPPSPGRGPGGWPPWRWLRSRVGALSFHHPAQRHGPPAPRPKRWGACPWQE